jgi:hypothetical protein
MMLRCWITLFIGLGAKWGLEPRPPELGIYQWTMVQCEKAKCDCLDDGGTLMNIITDSEANDNIRDVES